MGSILTIFLFVFVCFLVLGMHVQARQLLLQNEPFLEKYMDTDFSLKIRMCKGDNTYFVDQGVLLDQIPLRVDRLRQKNLNFVVE